MACIIGSCSLIPLLTISPRLTSEKRYFSIFQSTDSLLSLSLVRWEFHYWDLSEIRVLLRNRDSVDRCFRVKKKGSFSPCRCFLLDNRRFRYRAMRVRWEGRLFEFLSLEKVSFDRPSKVFFFKDDPLLFRSVTCNDDPWKRNEFLTTEILLKVSRVGLAGFKNKSVGLFVAFQRT